jgi:MFS family permease
MMAEAPAQPAPTFQFRNTFAALKYPNYRLWFVGQLISMFGTWMQMTAQGYLIFELTRSPVFLGYVGFAAGIPSGLLMLFGGVIADRVNRRTLLIVAQTFMMILALVLAALTFTGTVRPWHILVLAALLGTANAFDAPARQAFILEMVERDVLTNAIALNGAMFNLAAAIGPAVGGMIYAWAGPGWCFAINGFSFVAVIVALLLMRLKPREKPPRQGSALAEVKEGLRYAMGHPQIRALMIMVGLTSLFGAAYATLTPAWAVKILHGDARTNGWMQSARGVGAVCGTLVIASLGASRLKGKMLMAGTFAFPVILTVFAFIRVVPLALVALAGVGVAFISVWNLSNAFIQTLTPDELRGRVMSVFLLTFFGVMPIGALMAGALAQRIGEPNTVILSSALSMASAALIWLLVPKLRTLE